MSEIVSHIRTLPKALGKVVKDAFFISLTLFKILVPIIILVKVLKELDLVQYLAMPLEPLMELAGLPAQTGLVWASALLGNIYSGMVVYVALVPDMGVLSVAQVTVLSTMMLIGHALPVEGKVAHSCGLSFWGQCALRTVGGFVCGLLLHLFLSANGMLAGPSRILWQPAPEAAGLLGWGLGELRNLGYIFVIITALVALMRLLETLRITDLFIFLLRPFLRLMGIGRDAATVTIIGLTMGITYGGGLIIHEVKSGRIGKRDVFSSMSLMGLSHALIEDTLLMALLGASFIGTFWFRLIFSMLAVALLTRVLQRFYPFETPIGSS